MYVCSEEVGFAKVFSPMLWRPTFYQIFYHQSFYYNYGRLHVLAREINAVQYLCMYVCNELSQNVKLHTDKIDSWMF